jgi:arsenate reductase
MTVTVYHNPQCSNSRRALEVIRAHGIEPEIVEYLKTPLSRDALAGLMAKMDVAVREVMRTKEAVYAELKLADADDALLLDAIAAHPVLLNRPIVVTDKGAKLCRPGDLAAELL